MASHSHTAAHSSTRRISIRSSSLSIRSHTSSSISARRIGRHNLDTSELCSRCADNNSDVGTFGGPRATRGLQMLMGHGQQGDSCYTYQVPRTIGRRYPLRTPAICDRWKSHVHLWVSRSSIVRYNRYWIEGHDPRPVHYSPDGPPPAFTLRGQGVFLEA